MCSNFSQTTHPLFNLLFYPIFFTSLNCVIKTQSAPSLPKTKKIKFPIKILYLNSINHTINVKKRKNSKRNKIHSNWLFVIHVCALTQPIENKWTCKYDFQVHCVLSNRNQNKELHISSRNYFPSNYAHNTKRN